MEIKNTENLQLASLKIFASKLGFVLQENTFCTHVLAPQNYPCKCIKFDTMVRWHNGHMHGKYRGFVWVAWARQLDKTSLEWNKVRQEYTDAMDARLVQTLHCSYSKKLQKIIFNSQIVKFN